MNAWECVWIAGEKGADLCVCVRVLVSITLHQFALHETNSAVFSKSLGLDHTAINVTVITTLGSF